jgi:hypothetical protein
VEFAWENARLAVKWNQNICKSAVVTSANSDRSCRWSGSLGARIARLTNFSINLALTPMRAELSMTSWPDHLPSGNQKRF